MKLRPKSKLLFAAAVGLALSAVAAHAQLVVNLSELATFSLVPVGGTNFSATNTGVVGATQTVRTGTGIATVNPVGNPFLWVSYDPISDGLNNINLIDGLGTLNTGNFLFDSPVTPANYFSSEQVTVNYNFDTLGGFDLTQTFTINLTPFQQGNFSGVGYSILPQNSFGSVGINGQNYSFATVISGNTGILFDGSHNTASVQFQFSSVPEPSTYAFAGVLALVGVVALRRRSSSTPPAALAA